ncbi:hypothetical protein [Kitasatospora sp. NPDC057223]|uniref:hypothetical protein n=1 Tax=Kitasatospora sp. NPDC057223 TaxID=3346055 RepID=UPI003627DC15
MKPEFWADEKLAAAVSRDGRLLYIGLWNLADEHARLRGSARYIKGQLFPYDDGLTVSMVDALLDELCAVRKAFRYICSDGDTYLFLPNLAKHQRLEASKVASRLPSPPEKFPETPLKNPPPPPSGGGLDHPHDGSVNESQNQQLNGNANIRADKSARGADNLSLLYVAGSMEHGAGSMFVSTNPDDEHSPVDAAEPRDTTPARHDVELICRTLADAVHGNTGKRPTYGKRWRDAARLMLDKDQIPLPEALGAIKWSADHEFWRSIVLSVPKLREKYQQMKLQAQRGRGTPLAATGTDGRTLSTADRRVADAAALSARLAAEENQ